MITCKEDLKGTPSKQNHQFVEVDYKGNWAVVFNMMYGSCELFDSDHNPLNIVDLAKLVNEGKPVFKKELIDWKKECILLLDTKIADWEYENETLGNINLYDLLDIYPEKFVKVVRDLNNVIENYYEEN